MRCVGANDHVARSTPSATPAACGAGVGELPMTFQCAGAVSHGITSSSRPAAPSSSDPVQTEVVHSDVSSARRIQASSRSSSSTASVPVPPGTTMMSGSGSSSKAASACR